MTCTCAGKSCRYVCPLVCDVTVCRHTCVLYSIWYIVVLKTSSECGESLALLDKSAFCLQVVFLTVCMQNKTLSFPVAQLDVEISRRYAVRAKQQQQRLTNIEIQVRQALETLKGETCVCTYCCRITVSNSSVPELSRY